MTQEERYQERENSPLLNILYLSGNYLLLKSNVTFYYFIHKC